jgi:hypothetical protein
MDDRFRPEVDEIATYRSRFHSLRRKQPAPRRTTGLAGGASVADEILHWKGRLLAPND